MAKDIITKLLLLTFLIRTIKSQETESQDQNNLSHELDQSDDTKSQDEPKKLGHMNQNGTKTSEHQGKNRNHIGIASTFNDNGTNKSEHNKNLDEDTDSQSNQVGKPKQLVSEGPGHLNKDGRQRKNKSAEHDSRNQDRLEIDSTHEIEDQKTSDETIKNTNLDTNTKTSTQDEQKTSERHSRLNKERPNHMPHTEVTDNDFAYMVAVMKGGTYVSAGALIDESWVLTAARGIHLMRETIRFLRIRLGSINYKKGGTLLPIKKLEIHPYFNSSKPNYDLALIMLSRPVRYTANLRSIRLQLTPKEVTTTHFIMTSWPGIMKPGTSQTIEIIKHRRILSVTHLHPLDSEECVEELKEIGAGHDGIMCFIGAEDACMRDTGAPAVINGVLWGIISSWRPENCDDEDSIFATLVSAKNISTWIHATLHGHRWQSEKLIKL